jgi:hypothetical protein
MSTRRRSLTNGLPADARDDVRGQRGQDDQETELLYAGGHQLGGSSL